MNDEKKKDESGKMNPNLFNLLTRTDQIMAGANGWHPDP